MSIFFRLFEHRVFSSCRRSNKLSAKRFGHDSIETITTFSTVLLWHKFTPLIVERRNYMVAELTERTNTLLLSNFLTELSQVFVKSHSFVCDWLVWTGDFRGKQWWFQLVTKTVLRKTIKNASRYSAFYTKQAWSFYADVSLICLSLYLAYFFVLFYEAV